ncbi:MAG TPA: ATP-binding protein [Pyrinomonadaceae bacterium]|nr:ATP-binding protein [Pyrinomonadaceae bacterium]
MEQPRQLFLSESEDLIDQVFASLDELREHPAPQQQRELIANIFRQVHRLKGSAASFGFTGLAEIAHEFEHLLSAMRSESVFLADAVLDACESATLALSESLTLAASGVIEPSRRDLFAKLRSLTPAAAADPILEASIERVLSQLPPELAQALTDNEKRHIGRRYATGNSLCVVATSFEIAGFEEQFHSLREKLTETGDVISTAPAVDPEQAGRVSFQILLASDQSIQTLRSKLEMFPRVSITRLLPASDSQDQATTNLSATNALAATFIRTDLNDLDRLLSAAHELSRVTTSALEGVQDRLPQERQSQFASQAEEIRRSFLQLQSDLINLRMVPLAPILQRAARAGRAAARAVAKQIKFETIGADQRLDKLLCDAIADPLVHLVRNAVDHGIESADVRAAAGKPAQGKVVIEAVRIGSRTRVRVTDDGRGIDPATIGQAAARLGIDTPPNLDIARSVRLIFRPGFTTLPAASPISGRGVGLDIVETTVEQVGGEVRVSSERGQSSIFEIRLPVTFSLLDSTIVRAGENLYCLANSDVIRSERIAAQEIQGESLRTAAGLIPLVRLRNVLGSPVSASANAELSVVTCELPLHVSGETGELFETRNGKGLIGLVVDSVAGSEEVLVRNLGRHAGRWYGVAGATELQDGTVALVLDLARLLSHRVIVSSGH